MERWPETVIEDFKSNKTKYREASFYRSSLLKLYPFINDLKRQNIGWAKLQFEESEDAMCCLKECFRDRFGGEVIVKVSD